MMMLSGPLLLVTVHCDHSHSPSALELQLAEMERAKELAKVCLDNGVGALLVSLAGVRVEVAA
jgi:hypothetical protein